MQDASSSTVSTTRESSCAAATSKMEFSMADSTSNTSAGKRRSTRTPSPACCACPAVASLLPAPCCFAPAPTNSDVSLDAAWSAAGWAAPAPPAVLVLPLQAGRCGTCTSPLALALLWCLSSSLQLTLWLNAGGLAPTSAALPQVLAGALVLALLLPPVMVGLLALLLPLASFCFDEEEFLLMTDAMTEAAKLSPP
jgi:hypothetical protein